MIKLFSLMLFISLSFGAIVSGIDAKTSKDLLDANKAVIMDVREIPEMKDGMAKGAIVLPMSMMNNNRAAFDQEINKIPMDKTIIVYCASGRRAQLVGLEIEKMGHKVLSLGSFSTWKEAGLPVQMQK